jgi:hypothetical protein
MSTHTEREFRLFQVSTAATVATAVTATASEMMCGMHIQTMHMAYSVCCPVMTNKQ